MEYHLEVLRNKRGRHYWRCKAMNGRIVCTSGEDYTRPSDAHRAAVKFAEQFPKATVVVYAP